jgi:TRAP-type C4-dicarboxylate transport system permease large subunit
VAYSIFVGFMIHRELNVKILGKSLYTAATTSGVIVQMLFFVTILGRLYTMQQVPMKIAAFLLSFFSTTRSSSCSCERVSSSSSACSWTT